jgi:hypothetical protein
VARVVAFAGVDVPESHFERCQLWRRKVPSEHWRRRLERMPLAARLEWALLVHELERVGLSQRTAERSAFRAIEPEPAEPGKVSRNAPRR